MRVYVRRGYVHRHTQIHKYIPYIQHTRNVCARFVHNIWLNSQFEQWTASHTAKKKKTTNIYKPNVGNKCVWIWHFCLAALPCSPVRRIVHRNVIEIVMRRVRSRSPSRRKIIQCYYRVVVELPPHTLIVDHSHITHYTGNTQTHEGTCGVCVHIAQHTVHDARQRFVYRLLAVIVCRAVCYGLVDREWCHA